MISLVKSVILTPSLFLLKYLLLEGRNWYFFGKLNTKKNEQSDKLRNNIQLSAPLYKGLDCLIVVYYSRVEPRYNKPLYDEFLDVTKDFLYPSDSEVYGKERNLVM